MNRRWDPEGTARGRVVLLHGIMSTAATWWRVGPALASRGWVVDALAPTARSCGPCCRRTGL
jgi:alpha-beta hydrolase superfamily lysophospholipase